MRVARLKAGCTPRWRRRSTPKSASSTPDAQAHTSERGRRVVPTLTTGAHPAVRPRLLRGQADREDRAAYEAAGGYQPGLVRAELIHAVAASRPRGRGGAGYPAARKLAADAGQAGEKVLVVNGEEGEPASVKDRWLLRSRPHLVIDGALRAARAVGAGSAYFYVSDTAAADSLGAAIAELDGAVAELRVWQVEPSYVAGE